MKSRIAGTQRAGTVALRFAASRELLTKFSQRSLQRDGAIEEFIAENGRQPTDNEVAVLVRETRADKLIEISTDELRGSGLASHKTDSCAGEPAIVRLAMWRSNPPGLTPTCRGSRLRATFGCSRPRNSDGGTSPRPRTDRPFGAEGYAHPAGVFRRVLRDRNEIATAYSLQREREMVDFVNRGIGRCERLGGDDQFVASDRLRPEQKRVVEFVLDSRDRVVDISGAAGTGKTATLQELRRGLMEARREDLAIAPTMSAVEELQSWFFRRHYSGAASAGSERYNRRFERRC